MNAILESVAARAANGWQRAGSKFDFEVLAMPGGSVMAPALWVYSMVSSALTRPKKDSTIRQTAQDAAGVSSGDSQESPGLHCDWSGCHCT
jgi:hypothetical protein